MLRPTDAASASWAPRFAASIIPGPPPVITAKPASPMARPVARAISYASVSRSVLADPNTHTAGPISRRRSNPSESSRCIRSSRSTSSRWERTAALSA